MRNSVIRRQRDFSIEALPDLSLVLASSLLPPDQQKAYFDVDPLLRLCRGPCLSTWEWPNVVAADVSVPIQAATHRRAINLNFENQAVGYFAACVREGRHAHASSRRRLQEATTDDAFDRDRSCPCGTVGSELHFGKVHAEGLPFSRLLTSSPTREVAIQVNRSTNRSRAREGVKGAASVSGCYSWEGLTPRLFRFTLPAQRAKHGMLAQRGGRE